MPPRCSPRRNGRPSSGWRRGIGCPAFSLLDPQGSAAANLAAVDPAAVRDETERTGHPLVGLLRVLQAACSDGAEEFVHFGATTQDIQDTGQALEMREVLDELYADALTQRTVVEARKWLAEHG